MKEKLIELQSQMYQYHHPDNDLFSFTYSPRLYFLPVGELFDLKYYGEGYDDYPHLQSSEFGKDLNFGFCALLDLLCQPDIASRIIGLSFDGPDEGANGSNSWDFTRIINSEVVFPQLREFKVKLTDLGDHNQSIIDGKGLLEGGMVAKLVAKMPVLQTLVLPSAPDYTFFEIGNHPLMELTLQAGYAHQGFIRNLSESTNFKSLVTLDWAEQFDLFDDLEIDAFTSFDDFKKLFTSKAFASVGHFKLRNSVLTQEELFALQKLNSVQFLYINSQVGKYVNHLMMKKK